MKSFLSKIVFVLFFLYAGQAYAIDSGTSEHGSLTPGGTASYSFTATSGQGVILYGNASYPMNISVYKPSGGLWKTSANRFSGAAPETGTYNIVVSASPTASGSFRLDYVRGAGGVSNGTLTSGQVYNGTLATNGLESFEFSGTAGQGILLYPKAAASMQILVYKPDGSLWNNVYNRFSGTLPSTGTYTVVLTGYDYNNSGSYYLNFVRGSAGTSNGSLTSGQGRYGIIAANGLESFEFSGTAGQGILLYPNAAFSMQVVVYKPDGSLWNSAYNRFSGALPNTGTYTVVIIGYNISDNGLYSLDYVKGASSVSQGTLISATPRTGVLQENGIQSYTFSGVASSSLSVTTSASYSTLLNIYKPDGSLFRTFYNSHSTTLPAVTGTYTIALAGYGTGNSGGYTVTVTTPPQVTSSNPEQSNPYQGQSCAYVPGNPSPTTGNPINFDLGYKIQTERDYSGGRLSFTRLYRSDSTWTDNTVGARWRHNYARTLTVTGSVAEIIDGSGTEQSYTLVGSDWVADNPENTAKFETLGGGGYAYMLADNTREVYDSGKKLVRIEYLGGGAVELAYDGGGLLETVTDENGRELEFTYASGKVATVTTPEGVFSYSYDGNGNLTEVENPASGTREYHYEDTNFIHALTGITDETAVRYATYAYDAQGRAVLSKHAGDVDSYSVVYNADGSVTTTNPLGKDTTYHFLKINGVRRIVQVDGHASTNCVAANRYYNYYENGWLMSKTDWEGNTTQYVRNGRGLVTKMTEAFGTAQARVTTTTYEANLDLPDIVTLGKRETNYDYDAYGRVTSVSVKDLDTDETRTTTYTYYANTTDGSGNTILGRVDTVTDPRGSVTKYTYNGDLLVASVTRAYGEAYAQTASYTYDAAMRVATLTEPNTAVTAFTYDSLGRILTSTRADATALEAVTTFTYDANGNVTQVELPNGAELSYTYDNAQRLTGVEDSLGNTITYTLDDAGNVTQTQYKDSTSALKYTQSAVFDELSRMIESLNAASDESLYAYDKNSNLTSYTDANTNATAYSYDALQRLVRETDALSGETDFAYNTLDDTTKVTDARDNETSYILNAFGEVIEEASPDRGTTVYEYDLAGNMVLRSNSPGFAATYAYDKLNRVSAVTYPNDTAQNVTFGYDSCTGGAGRLCSVTDASGTTAYEYDLLGRVTESAETRGGLTFTTGYSYDLAGALTGITLPSGRTITYGLNANGQTSSVTADVAGSGTTLASSITYLPFGPVTSMTYGNALTFSATYDQNYWPLSRAVSSLYTNAYATDDAGNITQIGGTDFGYDALNRLDEEDSGSATTYTYDATSNRLTKVSGGTTTTTVPATSNKISAVGGNSYTYDASGNITGDGVREYVWDSTGRLKEVKISASTVGAYTYNAYNQRTKKVAGGVTTHYVYGAGGLLYGEYDNSGNFIREYVYLNGAPLAQVNAGSPETVTYLHPDHLGTPKFGTNAGGTQVWAWAPDAFGNGSPSGAATVNLRMPGQFYDAESSLFYNWNRYYNPATGRYISSDPIGLEGGINTFLYAAASPVMMVDPEGLYSWWDFQGDLADAQIGALEGLAGLSDSLTFGQSRRYRQEQGLEYADTCSTAYQAGDWTGTGMGLVTAGAGIARGGLRIEMGNWKRAGEWMTTKGKNLLHFHWGKGSGLQSKHLPYELGDWMRNFQSLVKRGLAGEDLTNIAITGAGSVSITGGSSPSCGCN